MKNSYLLYAFSVLIASASQVLLKKQANGHKKSFLEKFLNIRVIVAYILLLASMIINSIALSDMDLSLVPFITASSFFWIMILSFLFLNEKPTRKKIAGVFIIFIGIVVSRL